MIVLIGLGNPGKEYEFTRHNAGKLFTRYLAEHPIEGIEAIETECYMNESGEWLARWLRHKAKGQAFVPRSSGRGGLKAKGKQDGNFPYPSALVPWPFLVAHDDLDIPLGNFKIQLGKGPRLHKGILSIENALGTTEFWRVRLGIGGSQFQHLKSQISNLKSFGEEYVLQPFSRAERRGLEALFPEIREQLREALRLPWEVAQERLSNLW